MQPNQSAHSWTSGNIFLRPIAAALSLDPKSTDKVAPFVVFRIGTTEVKTQVCSKGQNNPEWNEELTIKASRGDQLWIEVRNTDPSGKVVVLGAGGIKAEDIADEPSNYQYFHGLFKDSKVTCDLLFAAALTSPVKVNGPFPSNPDSRHQNHLHYARVFKRGVIYIKPVEAHLTRDTDALLKMSSRVVFKNGDKELKTKVCHAGGKTPHWDEEVELPVTRGDNITIEVWNCHTIGKDELIAECKVHVDDMIDSKYHYQVEHPLHYDGKSAGHILIASSLIHGVLVSKLPGDIQGRLKKHIQLAESWKSGIIHIQPFLANLTRDIGGAFGMNPYFILKFGDKQIKSKAKSGQEVYWDEEYEVEVSRGDTITLEVWDHHKIGDDKIVGIANVAVNSIVDCKEHYQYRHSLKFEDKEAGFISFAASLAGPVLLELDPEKVRAARERQEHMMHMMHMMHGMNHLHH